MKFEKTEVWGFEHALRGMRNPKNSWDKSDSSFCSIDSKGECRNPKEFLLCEDCQIRDVTIGNNDMKLAQTLIKAGSEHRKFMRQIFVSVDITAPLYWWKEFDTYKVGTVSNSTSTMHKLATTPITLDCFEIDDYNPAIEIGQAHRISVEDIVSCVIPALEGLRLKYLETKDKRYWKELIRLLPESWLQKRTVTMNYENLLAMCSSGQRRYHKLNEWSGMDNPQLPNFIAWARTLPYAQELLFLDELEEKKGERK